MWPATGNCRGRIDFCTAGADADDPRGAVHRCIHAVAHLIEDHAAAAGLPLRFASTKLVEGDGPILEALDLDQNEKEMLGHSITELESETGLDREAALADMRFTFIEKLCAETVVKPGESREHKRSVAIDRILTGKYTALPCFVGIIALVFWLTFGVIGALLSDWMTLGIDALTGLVDGALAAYEINPVVHSLVIDGIFAGVGSVLSFLPTIVTLFFFLSILEDTGYMARVAFVMDKLLRRIGLSGRSFVPMLIGFGCSVPAIMATRTLSSDRDRRMTILLTPFMSCSAKLPIYALFTAAFFPVAWRAPVMIFLYLFGILCGILYAFLLKHTRFHGEPVPFVMELPNYRLPSARSVAQLIWEKARDFVQRAFTIIFVATVIIWFLQTFDARLNVAATPDSSLLAMVGSLIRAHLRAAGLRGLARFHRTDHRFYRQGERGQHLDGAAGRQHRGAVQPVHPLHGGGVPGVHPAVHALRGRHRRRPAGDGQRPRRRRGGFRPVRHRLGGGFPGTRRGAVDRFGINFTAIGKDPGGKFPPGSSFTAAASFCRCRNSRAPRTAA